MIGIWQRFGEGVPPENGAPIVYARYDGNLVTAIYEYGSVRDSFGNIQSAPYGQWWTSLPPLPRSDL